MTSDAKQTATTIDASRDGLAADYRTTPKFDKLVEKKLPASVKALVPKVLKKHLDNPAHPALNHHPLGDSKRGRHKNESFSINVTFKYRAIGVRAGTTNLWYWVGSHNDYENFIGKK